ncbi:MAG: AI-2E family transporter [Treponema sp.]|nr:AI-2E family transporter [Treponema sp.]
MLEEKYQKSILYILLFFAVIVASFIMKELSSVFLPIIISILLAIVFYPVITKLHTKLKFPWVLAALLIVFLLLCGIGSISSLLTNSLGTIFSEYPKYEIRLMNIFEKIANSFNLEFDQGKSLIQNLWGILQIRDFIQKAAVGLSSGIVTSVKSVLVLLLMLAFLLIELGAFSKKIHIAFEDVSRGAILNISRQIISDVTRYLSIKFFISLATGLLVYAGVAIIGLDFPIVWGFFAFIMNFIPTFGSIISTVITSLFALLQFYPEWGKIIYVVVLLISVNFVLGNIIEPRIEGRHLGLSPFAILISLSIWGWIWGFIGMILAVPMTVIIKIVCQNIPELKRIAIFLSNNPEETIKTK